MYGEIKMSRINSIFILKKLDYYIKFIYVSFWVHVKYILD